ncbi:hypothetical protein NN561_018487 [Cricetulus griseus]
MYRFGSVVGWVSEREAWRKEAPCGWTAGRRPESGGQSQGPFPSTNQSRIPQQPGPGSRFAGRDPPARWGPSSPTATGPASRTTEPWRVPQPQCFWAPALAPAVTSSWGHGASMRSRAARAIHSFDELRLSGYYLRSGEWTA